MHTHFEAKITCLEVHPRSSPACKWTDVCNIIFNGKSWETIQVSINRGHTLTLSGVLCSIKEKWESSLFIITEWSPKYVWQRKNQHE